MQTQYGHLTGDSILLNGKSSKKESLKFNVEKSYHVGEDFKD